VFALGVRDPRGFARDPLSGVMYFVDRSPGNRSEVNRLELAGNFGWADAFGLSGTPPFVDPIFDSRGSAPAWSGIGFNPGLQFGPSQLKTLVIGESAHRQLRLLTLDATLQSVTGDRVLATGLPGEVVDVAFSPSGALYVACTNAILRIVPYP
jgi:glucose/arabinose dehydrogenase